MNELRQRRESRRQKKLERLETNNPECLHCGEGDPRCLERHHVAGRAHDDETVVECRNCHGKLSDAQNDHPKGSAGASDPLERIGRFLLGIADLFELLISKLRQFGRSLIEQANATFAAGEVQS
jgi:hypothetical protein